MFARTSFVYSDVIDLRIYICSCVCLCVFVCLYVCVFVLVHPLYYYEYDYNLCYSCKYYNYCHYYYNNYYNYWYLYLCGNMYGYNYVQMGINVCLWEVVNALTRMWKWIFTTVNIWNKRIPVCLSSTRVYVRTCLCVWGESSIKGIEGITIH